MKTLMHTGIIKKTFLTLTLVFWIFCINLNAQEQSFLAVQDTLRKGIMANDVAMIKSAVQNGANIDTRISLASTANVLPIFLAVEDTHTMKVIERELEKPFLSPVEIKKQKVIIENDHSFYSNQNQEKIIIKEEKRVKKNFADYNITALKLLAEGFWTEGLINDSKFVKAELNKETFYMGIMCDVLMFAMFKNNIPAVKYLNSLPNVSVNDRDELGVPKLFYVQNLEMLEALVKQDADIFAETSYGLNFVNYLLTNITSYSSKKNEEDLLEIINYLTKQGIKLIQTDSEGYSRLDINPLINIVSSQDPQMLDEIISLLGIEALCKYLSQPDQNGKTLLAHLIETLNIEDDNTINKTVEIYGEEYNILEYVIGLLKDKNFICECVFDTPLLPLSQYKDENGNPLIYNLNSTESNNFLLDELVYIDNKVIVPSYAEGIASASSMNIKPTQALSLLEEDTEGDIYINYISNQIFDETVPKNLRFTEDTENYFKATYTKTLEEINTLENPYIRQTENLDEQLLQAYNNNDFVSFVQLALAGADINQTNKFGAPLIKKALENHKNPFALYIVQHKNFDSTIETANDYLPMDWAVEYSNNIVFQAMVENNVEISSRTRQRAKKKFKFYSEQVQKRVVSQKSTLLAMKSNAIMKYITNLEDERETAENEAKKEIQKETFKSFMKVRQDFPF